MLTEDYIIRMIRDMGTLLSRVLGREVPMLEEEQERLQGVSAGTVPPLLAELKALCDRGEINRAENLLFDTLDFSDPATFPVALGFYEHLNGFSDRELEARDYSREEIFDGLRDCAENYGIDPQLVESFRL